MHAALRTIAFAVTLCGLTSPALAAEAKAEKTAPAPAAATSEGKAGGAITVNGKTTTLTFAYARSVPGFFDKTKNDVELILSDVPLDAKALSDQFVRIDMAKEGKLHAFEIIINAEGAPISTTWRHNGFKGPTPSGLSTADVFTKKVFDGKRIEGAYKSAKPGDFFDNIYAFDVSFQAPIAH